jgi:hypothetical protein
MIPFETHTHPFLKLAKPFSNFKMERISHGNTKCHEKDGLENEEKKGMVFNQFSAERCQEISPLFPGCDGHREQSTRSKFMVLPAI